jgi:hypothetical protein
MINDYNIILGFGQYYDYLPAILGMRLSAPFSKKKSSHEASKPQRHKE